MMTGHVPQVVGCKKRRQAFANGAIAAAVIHVQRGENALAVMLKKLQQAAHHVSRAGMSCVLQLAKVHELMQRYNMQQLAAGR